ncbi:MAG: polyphosphate kinase 2 [Gammaproteobacteria bacterium]|nr:polyphosphate kinase 2 [Gammaproteobacteria bacterium]
MGKVDYEKELRELQADIARLQRWVTHAGLRVIVLFEGRDTAGKGGMIRAITQRASARVFRVVALPAPTERERTQLYLQRYVAHFPAAGEVVLFDRSWYNRAGVEPVMGFCTEAETTDFLRTAPGFESYIIHSGIILLKYWLEVGQAEQKKRLLSRVEDPVKRWKLSDMDLEGRKRWYAYSRARDRMLDATDTAESPWYIVPSDDQRTARLNCIRHLLSTIPHDKIEPRSVVLPGRDLSDEYDDVAALAGRRFVPQPYGDDD